MKELSVGEKRKIIRKGGNKLLHKKKQISQEETNSKIYFCAALGQNIADSISSLVTMKEISVWEKEK
jgi:hypothetical protein